jgi:hypothetical protein
MTTSNLPELQARWIALDELATRLSSDDRRLSTALAFGDPLVRRAYAWRVPPVTPLTVGTLLAAVLGELDGVELAIESIRRNEHPGEDRPDPLAGWQPRAERYARGSAAGAGSA